MINEILQAIQSGDEKKVLQLLSEWGNHNDKNYENTSQLMIAAITAHMTDVVRFCIDSNFISINYDSLLYRACDAGATDIAKLCIEAEAKNIEKTTFFGMKSSTSFIAAASKGMTDIVKLILERGLVQDINEEDMGGHTALDYASEIGNIEMAKLLIKWNADNVNDGFGRNALYYACWTGNIEMAKLLITWQLEKNVAVDNSKAFHAAILRGATEIAKLMFDNSLITDADINQKINGNPSGTPLDIALFGGKYNCAEWLISKNAVAEKVCSRGVFFWASTHGQVDVLRVVLDNGLHIKGKKENYQDYLDAALYVVRNMSESPKGVEDVINLLTERGAKDNKYVFINAVKKDLSDIVSVMIYSDAVDINFRDDDQKTALWHACYHGNHKIVKWFMEVDGIDTVLADASGMTPLMIAVKDQDKEIIRLILDKDVKSINVSDVDGHTVLEYADEKWYSGIGGLLRSYGAHYHQEESGYETDESYEIVNYVEITGQSDVVALEV